MVFYNYKPWENKFTKKFRKIQYLQRDCWITKNEVRDELLKQYKEYPELVENIITTTDCIPIYLDLAIKTVAKMSEKKSLKIKFISKKRWYYSSIFGPFKWTGTKIHNDIVNCPNIWQVNFEYLIKDLNLQIDVLEYETICNRTLIRNLENDKYFYKIHDIISDNISTVATPPYRERVLKSYLNYIHLFGLKNYSDIQINMLFKHVLTLFIKFDITLSQEYNEALLDIFFVIKEANIPFNCFEIIDFNTNNNFKYLLILLEL